MGDGGAGGRVRSWELGLLGVTYGTSTGTEAAPLCQMRSRSINPHCSPKGPWYTAPDGLLLLLLLLNVAGAAREHI